VSRFTDLKDWCEPVDQGPWWRAPFYVTTKSVEWEIGVKGSGLWLRVPEGFTFNVSIPFPLWPILSPRDGRFLKAGALHDYALKELYWASTAAAAPFSESLKAQGVSRLVRWLMVQAVVAWEWR